MSEQDIIKQYGDVFLDPMTIVNNPPEVLSISPRIDFALGGGVPEGSLVVLTGPEKVGKDQPLYSMVYTPNGPVKMADLNVGDIVCTPNGECEIEDIYPQGIKDVYRVYFSDGSHADCGLEHLWHVHKKDYWATSKTVTLKSILKDSLFSKKGKYKKAKYGIDITAIHFNEKHVKLDPYLLGVILGDGGISQKSLLITNTDKQLINTIENILDCNYTIKQSKYDPITYRISRNQLGKKNKYIQALKHYKLMGCTSKEKFIPSDFKYNSFSNRLALIQGLMDTDGTVDKKGKVSFYTSSKQLAMDFAEVVRSLGYKCKILDKTTKLNGRKFKSFVCYISNNIHGTKILFNLNRKKERCKIAKNTATKKIVKIEKIDKCFTQCIKLANNEGLYFTDGVTMTHNTVTALQLCKNAQKKLYKSIEMVEDESSKSKKKKYIEKEVEKKRKIYYANIEGRLKKRDLEGIRGLDLSSEDFKLIASTQGNILAGEKYLGIIDSVIKTEPHSVCVIDSFSALSAEKEMNEDIEATQVAAISRTLSKFNRRVCNILPVNKVTVVGITHLTANIGTFGSKKTKVEKSANSLKYAQDIKLWATYAEPLIEGDKETGKQIGQKVHWKVENSAIGPPGIKFSSVIKYGVGIWEEYELIDMAKDFGIIEQSGSWLKYNGETLAQGILNAVALAEEDKDLYNSIKNDLNSLIYG